jgi:hypothetical protein
MEDGDRAAPCRQINAGGAPSRKVCKRFVFAMCFARVSGDDVIIVVESSSTGQRDEPCMPQARLIESEEVVKMC